MSVTKKKRNIELPPVEKVQEELAKAESMDDFFGRDEIFAQLFSQTMEEMLESELSEHLGYERYEAEGRNSGNVGCGRSGYGMNWKRSKNIR